MARLHFWGSCLCALGMCCIQDGRDLRLQLHWRRFLLSLHLVSWAGCSRGSTIVWLWVLWVHNCGCTCLNAIIRELSGAATHSRTLLSCSPIQRVLPKFYNSQSHTHCLLHSVSKQCDTACYRLFNRPSVVSGGFFTVQHWQLRYSAKAYWFVQGGFCVCKYRVSFGLAHKSDTVE